MYRIKSCITFDKKAMRVIYPIVLVLLLASCNSKTQTDKTNPVSSENTETLITNKSKIHTNKKIIFDPSLTTEEWINTIWMDVYGEHPEEIIGILELDSPSDDEPNLFFVIKSLEESHYYTLLMDTDQTYDLKEITTSENSWINSYAKSPHCTAGIYDLVIRDINYDDVTEILVSVEIQGMTEAEDGMKPFQKVQHDVLSITNGKITHNDKLTAEFNIKYGVRINEDSGLNTFEFLGQKYYSTISNEFEHQKMEMLLKDIEVLTSDKNDSQNVFRPVRKVDTDGYVVDLGYNFYDSYFLPYSNNFELSQLTFSDYPIFYIQDHGDYIYSIIHIKVDDNIITLTLDKKYYRDENTGEYNRESTSPLIINLQYLQEKWVLTNESSTYFMMKKDTEDLETIDSNKGQ